MSKTTKARKPQPAKPPEVYTAATILPGEAVNARFAWSSKDAALVARCSVGTMATIVNMRATACAQQQIRLYRAVSKGSGKSIWKTRKVTDKKHLAYMRDTSRNGPGFKAATYARDTDEIEEVLDHPAAVLMRRPNPTMTGEAWHHQHFRFTDMCGRVYAYVEMGAAGVPVALYHLFPQFTRAIPSQTTLIGGYSYGRNTSQIRMFKPEEVIYYRPFHSPMDPTEAWSWSMSMQMEADYENAAMVAEQSRWSNGGQPGMVIKLPQGTTETQKKQAEQGINGQIRGVLNSGKALLLVNADATQIGQKPADMNFQGGMDHVVAKMFRAGGIPDGMWKQGSAALANAEQADPLFMGGTIKPLLQLNAAEHTDYLLPMFGVEPGDMWFEYDDCVAEDRAAMVKEAVDLCTVGVTSREAQANKLGYEAEDVPERGPMDAQEIIDTTATDVPDQAALSPGEDAPAAAASQGSLQQEALNGAQTQALAALATQAANKELPVDTARAIAQASNPLLSPEALDAIFGPLANFEPPKPEPANVGGDGTVGGASPGAGGSGGDTPKGNVGKGDSGDAGTKKLTALETKEAELPNQPKAVDDALAALEAKVQAWYEKAMMGAVTDVGGVNLSPFVAELQAIIGTGITQVADAAATDAAKELGGSATSVLDNPHAAQWAKANAAEAVTRITETLRETLAQRITDGLANNQSINEIQSQIQKDAPEFSVGRAELIAKNESAVAIKRGNDAAWTENGIEKRRMVLSSSPCKICTSAFAQNPDPIPLASAGGAFVVDGVRFEFAHYHPGCYCDEVAVIEQEAP